MKITEVNEIFLLEVVSELGTKNRKIGQAKRDFETVQHTSGGNLAYATTWTKERA
jgi:hypothetical protein